MEVSCAESACNRRAFFVLRHVYCPAVLASAIRATYQPNFATSTMVLRHQDRA